MTGLRPPMTVEELDQEARACVDIDKDNKMRIEFDGKKWRIWTFLSYPVGQSETLQAAMDSMSRINQ